MSSMKLKVAVFAASIASAAGGSALLTEATALANAIPHGAPAQSEISHYQPNLRRSVRPELRRSVRPELRRSVRPELRRSVRPELRRATPEAIRVLPGFRR
jgi:hypothetical protein